MNCLWILLLLGCCNGGSFYGNNRYCGCNRGLRYRNGDCGCDREARYDNGDCGCDRNINYHDGDCGCDRDVRYGNDDCDCDNNTVTTSYKSYQSYERKDY